MTFQKKFVLEAGVLMLAVLIICNCCYLYAEEEAQSPEQMQISSIEVAGNVTITKSRVLARIRAKAGQLFNSVSTAEDAQRLAEIEGIETAYYNTDIVDGKVKLTFVVIEQDLVRLIFFRGNKKVSANLLSKQLDFKKGDYLDLLLVRNATVSMLQLYHKRGYAFAEVTLDESQLKRGSVIYNIKEGTRVRVKKSIFEGNDSIKRKELKKAVKTKSRKFVFFRVYYNEDAVRADVEKLQDIYHKKGFLDVKVEEAVSFSENKKQAFVTFKITEGALYTVDEVIITGNEFFDDSVLYADLKLQKGEVYSVERADFDARHILNRYREKGFVDAVVEQERSFGDEGRVTVRFDIVQGSRFRIGRIDITGNHEVHDRVIRRILDEEGFTPGQWYNADFARGNGEGELERLVRRRVMTESTTILPAGDKPDQKDANVNIVESQTGSIMVGAGIASNSGVIGNLVLDQRNFDIKDWPESFREFVTGKAFKGAGQQFRAEINPGTIQSSFSISFTEPYLYDKPVSLEVGTYGFERMQETFDEDRLKGYVGFEKRYDNDWRRGVSFRVENVDVSDLEPDAPQEIIDVKGDTALVGVKAFVRKDTTDSRFLPTKGYNFNIGYEQVGGDFTFGILSATQRWYKTLYEDLADRKTILETKIHAATILGDAPPFEKFYAGGTGSIRGFKYRGVSTRDSVFQEPIGSDWILLGNAEIAVPLTSEVFSALFFVDAGTIDSGGVRASIGTGIQILLPQWFGPVPMRFELATPFMKDDEDDTRIFSFSVGALF